MSTRSARTQPKVRRWPWSRLLVATASLLVLTLGVAACGGDDEDEPSSKQGSSADAVETSPDGVVAVELGEGDDGYFVKVDKDSVPAGETTFKIDNVGKMHHELIVYRTDLDPGALPIGEDGKATLDEESIIGEAVYANPPRGDADHRIRDGRGVDFTLDLEPGKYVLLCNLAGHYAAKQYVAFTVEEPTDEEPVDADEPAIEPEPAPVRDEAKVEGTPVKVQLGEAGSNYFVKVDKPSVAAGTITFVIDNVGKIHHELLVYRTDLDPAKIPIGEDGKAELEEAGIIGEAVYTTPLRGDPDHRIRDGRGVNYTVDLEPGKYVLLCDLAGHFAAKQYVAFTVT